MKILQRNLNRSTFVVWEMKRNVSVVRLIVATRSSGPLFKFRCNILISGNIIKEMPGSVASGTPYITPQLHHNTLVWNGTALSELRCSYSRHVGSNGSRILNGLTLWHNIHNAWQAFLTFIRDMTYTQTQTSTPTGVRTRHFQDTSHKRYCSGQNRLYGTDTVEAIKTHVGANMWLQALLILDTASGKPRCQFGKRLDGPRKQSGRCG